MAGGKRSKYESLSKFMTLILRHRPDILGLEMDREGFVDLNLMIKKMRKTPKFHWVTIKDIFNVVESDEKKRFEIKNSDDKVLIRARYGHSAELDVNIDYEEIKPGEVKFLYHGTNAKVLPWILREGLIPMARKYVHLSLTPDDAYLVGARRRGKVVILKVNVDAYLKDGGKIWKATDRVYLAKHIPPKYLSIHKYG